MTDPRSRTCRAAEVGFASLEEPPVALIFVVLTKVPDVALLVLCEEDELGFRQLFRLVVDIPNNDSAHAVDHLGESVTVITTR